ncbi:MAG: hypothetical protein ACLQFR_17580 [Streptosporangiaceae bacterium]
MTDVAPPAGQRAAAEYVRQLLLKPGRYRLAWQQQVVRPRDDVINQMAVAEVIAGQLRSAPARGGDANVMPYQLREIVADVLAGRQVSRQSLRMFIDGFGFTDDEAARLWQLWKGATTVRVIAGSHVVPMLEEHEVTRALGPRRHLTLTLHDHIWVGADARIERARTLQVIEATAQAVDRIPFLADTNVLTLEVGQGCTEVAGEIIRIGPDVFATHILLATTLDLGETSTLEYWLSYRYPGDPDDPAERQYRRAVFRHIANYDMRVEFHPERIPARVWWAQWDGANGAVLEEEAVQLDSQRSAHRYLRSFEKAVAGFHWEWPGNGIG